MAKTYGLKCSEEEVRALIQHHSANLCDQAGSVSMPNPETSQRIHDLTKRLNKSDDTDTETKQSEPQPNTGWPVAGAIA